MEGCGLQVSDGKLEPFTMKLLSTHVDPTHVDPETLIVADDAECEDTWSMAHGEATTDDRHFLHTNCVEQCSGVPQIHDHIP